MAEPREKHTCPTCHGLWYIRREKQEPRPRQYCCETLDHSDCPALDMPREQCRLGHPLAFRVPADIQEGHNADSGWFRVGYLHRRCPDFESLNDE
jgi:hypothetical protein